MEKPAVPSGRFVWYDLMTTDIDKAKAFYSKLFGWNVKEVDMGPMGTYPMIHAGEQGIGGMMRLPPGAGAPSHWIGYATSGDVDAAAATVQELGGRVMVPPTDIPGVGRFTVIADPQGALVAPFKPNPRDDAPPQKEPGPGEFCWVELHTSDQAAAESFYTKLFGWTLQRSDMGGMTYTLLKNGEREEGGVMQMQPGAPYPPMWLPYVAVADADKASAEASELGARVVMPTMAIPGIGRFAVILDPTGASLALFDRQGAKSRS